MKGKPYIISVVFLVFAILLAYIGLQKIIDQQAIIQVWYGPVTPTPDEVNLYHGTKAIFIGLAIISGGVVMAMIAILLLGFKKIRVAAFVIGGSLAVMTFSLFPPVHLATNLKSASFYSLSFIMLLWRIVQKYLGIDKSEEVQAKVQKLFLGFVVIFSFLASILGQPDISTGLMSSLFIFGGILIAYDIVLNLKQAQS